MSNGSMFRIIRDDIAIIESEIRAVIHSQAELLTSIGEHLIQAGGKRLRPALYLLCARSGRSEPEHLLKIAVAIELIHMATLVHDDVIDNAGLRRGIPTTNACWGKHIAVLSGDYLFSKAFSIVADIGDNRVLKILANVICAMCEGEVIQSQHMFNPEQSEDDYLRLIARKTADFMAATCQLGGMSAHLDVDNIMALREYGHLVGMAFQITDDILDLTSSVQQLGKPVGNDLRNGLVTLPVLRALNVSSDKNELKDIIAKRIMSEEDWSRCLQIIHGTDAIEYSYSKVKDFLAQARIILPSVLTGDIRTAILTVADFVRLRKY